VEVSSRGQADDGPKTMTERASGAVAVADASFEVRHPRSAIESDSCKIGGSIGADEQDLATPGMFDQVCGGFGNNNRNPLDSSGVKIETDGELASGPARLGHLTGVFNADPDRFRQTISTSVLRHVCLHLVSRKFQIRGKGAWRR
jgi:hypothetical protein